MKTTEPERLSMNDLRPYDDSAHSWAVTGFCQFTDLMFPEMEVNSEAALTRFLDFALTMPGKSPHAGLKIEPRIYGPNDVTYAANLRFDFDRHAHVGGAATLVIDRNDDVHCWQTVGNAGRDDVHLDYDHWCPDEKRIPRSAFIPLSLLREVIVQWAFGGVFPPPSADWEPISGRGVAWF